MPDTKEQFLEKYRKLCEESGWYMWACGCCNSPEPMPIKPNEVWDARPQMFKKPA